MYLLDALQFWNEFASITMSGHLSAHIRAWISAYALCSVRLQCNSSKKNENFFYVHLPNTHVSPI
jgi:hypothetical protein